MDALVSHRLCQDLTDSDDGPTREVVLRHIKTPGSGFRGVWLYLMKRHFDYLICSNAASQNINSS